MDVSMNVANLGDAVGVAVLKKALNADAQGAMALINSIQPPAQGTPSLPPHLGQNVNTTA